MDNFVEEDLYKIYKSILHDDTRILEIIDPIGKSKWTWNFNLA